MSHESDHHDYIDDMAKSIFRCKAMEARVHTGDSFQYLFALPMGHVSHKWPMFHLYYRTNDVA